MDSIVVNTNTLPEQLCKLIRGERVSIREENGEVILTPIASTDTRDEISEQTTSKPKRKLHFLEGPPLPDSFFDPLPEEELQAWGL